MIYFDRLNLLLFPWSIPPIFVIYFYLCDLFLSLSWDHSISICRCSMNTCVTVPHSIAGVRYMISQHDLCLHIQTHIHTYIHTYIHTFIHSYRQIYIHSYIHKYIDRHIDRQTYIIPYTYCIISMHTYRPYHIDNIQREQA